MCLFCDVTLLARAAKLWEKQLLPSLPFPFFFFFFLHLPPWVSGSSLQPHNRQLCSLYLCVCVWLFPPRRFVCKISTSLRKSCVTDLRAAFRSGDPSDILSFWKSCWQTHPCVLHPLKIWSKGLGALHRLHKHWRLRHCSVVLLWHGGGECGVWVLARESWIEVLRDVP